MELLKKTTDLYDELRDLTEEIDTLEKKLKAGDYKKDNFDELYAREFELSIRIVGAYEDIMYCLEKMQKEGLGHDFFVKRMKDNVHKLMKFGGN